ncbi:hypothetical protein SAMN05421595_1919 [Austwickia chelonae]|uniref:Glycerophosphoryl diester phosphodiesterase membrane domain-containing protein n=1 Tax=Austwickia chelonae NBRC 105200 TaxID=1184607 RepID=K6VN28_9MICO|nr:hypothetical protein [Austwickia chelonae]GAB76785.1 hypothetical protein AUCHE_03_00020 [Austwickia chelonae NBRC 105200]SEW30682.1 hypothetical protein SAMN05421595_1919 [Austwickia chelonae]
MSQGESLAAPGPPSAGPTGPVYGARYGEPAYEAQWGTSGTFPPPMGLSATSQTAPPGPPSTPTRPGARLLTFRPGVVTLRPLSINDILDGAIRTIRRRPGLFIGVAALGMAVATVVRAVIDVSAGVTLMDASGGASRLSPSTAVKPVLAVVVAGLLAAPTADAVLGRRLGWGQVREALSAHRFSLLKLVAVIAAITGGTTFLAWFAMGGREAQLSNLTFVLWTLGLVQFLLLIPFSAAPAVSVIEGAGPVRALRRSFSLMRGFLGRAFLMVLVSKLLIGIMTAVIAAPLQLGILVLSQTTGYQLMESAWSPAVNMLMDLLAGSLTLPFEAVVFALFYIDLRVRGEGLDVLLVDEARREADR